MSYFEQFVGYHASFDTGEAGIIGYQDDVLSLWREDETWAPIPEEYTALTLSEAPAEPETE